MESIQQSLLRSSWETYLKQTVAKEQIDEIVKIFLK